MKPATSRAHDILDYLESVLTENDMAGFVDELRGYVTALDGQLSQMEAENSRLRSERGMPRTGASQTLTVAAGDGSYTREQPVIRVAWVCEICGKQHDREQLPANAPKYCPPAPGQDYSDCQKEARRGAVRRHRDKVKSPRKAAGEIG